MDSAAVIYDELQADINALPSPNLRTVLCARYLDLLTWNRVTVVLFANREDFEQKSDRYIRQVFKLHGTALAGISQIRKEREPKNAQQRDLQNLELAGSTDLSNNQNRADRT